MRLNEKDGKEKTNVSKMFNKFTMLLIYRYIVFFDFFFVVAHCQCKYRETYRKTNDKLNSGYSKIHFPNRFNRKQNNVIHCE